MITNIKLMVVLAKLSNSFSEPLKRNLESLGTTMSVYLALAHLNEVGKAKTQTIGQVASISSGTITHTVNKMVKANYITKYQDEEDKRIYWVEITDEGKRHFDAIHIKHQEYLQMLLSDFTEEEKKLFIEQIKYFGKTIERRSK